MAAVAVEEVSAAVVRRYGIVIPREAPAAAPLAIEVANVIEKPDPAEVESRLAIAGRYVLGPEVFAELRRTATGRHPARCS